MARSTGRGVEVFMGPSIVISFSLLMLAFDQPAPFGTKGRKIRFQCLPSRWLF